MTEHRCVPQVRCTVRSLVFLAQAEARHCSVPVGYSSVNCRARGQTKYNLERILHVFSQRPCIEPSPTRGNRNKGFARCVHAAFDSSSSADRGSPNNFVLIRRPSRSGGGQFSDEYSGGPELKIAKNFGRTRVSADETKR